MKPKDYRQTDPCCMDQEAHMMEGWGEDKEVLLKKKKHTKSMKIKLNTRLWKGPIQIRGPKASQSIHLC